MWMGWKIVHILQQQGYGLHDPGMFEEMQQHSSIMTVQPLLKLFAPAERWAWERSRPNHVVGCMDS